MCRACVDVHLPRIYFGYSLDTLLAWRVSFRRLSEALLCTSLWWLLLKPAAPSLAQDLWAESLGDGNLPKRERQGEHPTSPWTATGSMPPGSCCWLGSVDDEVTEGDKKCP